MNKQRKVLITITYNEMGIIIDTKTEELGSSAKPKRGKWIYGEDSMADGVDGYRCDQCGFFVPWDYQHKSIDYIKDYNFCPNCGADMRTAEQIVHDAIDNTPMAEDAYSGIKERLHKAVDDMREVTNGN